MQLRTIKKVDNFQMRLDTTTHISVEFLIEIIRQSLR